ncbi:response regulator transcription factor [Paenibacillus radicis (ex Xue et al. 2023)]|uniref:Response regulator n=1 Tax=Paenibacillus radicis (ex Xue et al. 2023) TaxID=2972489 RepID=A0ABT1YKD1_9BACL|nr:response regulator [Paenibacillus radicis (ex Xue et al. 2023)]MCR8633185.1 response regulator [Paenibacillus radicis (ex Xue et al. 2023)]
MRKILIVDDEKLLRKGFIHMTDWPSHGFQIVGEAANGEDALQLVADLNPDIVVTDIKMPGIDGLELIRAIKSAYPQTEVIVLSSYSDFPYVKESLQLGAADYILKASMTFDEVLAALRKWTPKNKDTIENDTEKNSEFMPIEQLSEQNKAFYGSILATNKQKAAKGMEEQSFLLDRMNWKVLRPYLEERDMTGLYDKVFDRAISLIQSGIAPEPYYLQKCLVELVYMLIHKMDEAGWNPVELQKHKISYFRRIESSSSFDVCMQEFKKVLLAIDQFVSSPSNSSSKYSPTIKAVTAYLHQKFGDTELSLNQIAKIFHVNKSYLSQLFKQQVGVNFQYYLTQIRIDKAKELLKQNVPVNEVCLAVGIDNMSYFSQFFKRRVGVSPTDYVRESNLSETKTNRNSGEVTP